MPSGSRFKRPPAGKAALVEIAAGIVVLAVVLLSVALVVGLFVWAAIQDGRKDRATQARLGIRRRTRLGR